MNKLLEEILNECSHYAEEGKLADYIPELAKANKEMLERVREQNKEILNTVENIEREVKED